MKQIPVYKFPGSYAQEHGELPEYRASNKANAACKEAIESAIRENYRDNHLSSDAAKQVVEQFGYDRVFHVLAVTVRQKDWDGRISQDTKQWAQTVPVHKNPDTWGTDRNCQFIVNSHPGLIDLFTSQVRRDYALEHKKISVRDKLQQAHKAAAPRAPAKSKGQER